MPAIQVLGVFCDDVREEASGMHTLVGVYPDNLNVPPLPVALAKLALYVRVAVDPHIDVLPMFLWLVPDKGEEKQVNAIDPELVRRAQKEARERGTPIATIMCRIIMAPFPIMDYGRVKAALRTGDDEIICASLNFQPTPAPIPSLPIGLKPPAKRPRAARLKKAPKP